MRRSNKISLVFLFLFLLLIALIPWMDGFYFKRHYLHLIDNFNRLENTNVKIQVIDYRVGWLQSTAKLQLALVSQSQFPLDVTVNQTIHHGPIVKDKINNQATFAFAAMDNYLHFPEQIEKFLLGNQTNKGVLEIVSVAYFNGDYFNKITTPIFALQMPGFGKMTWEGLKGDFNFKIDNDMIQKMDNSFTCGILTAESEESSPISLMRLKVQPITSNTSAVREQVGLWSGHSEVIIPAITLNKVDQLLFSLENLNVNYNIAIDSNNYSLSEKIALQKLEIPNTDIPTISPANFTLSVNNLNAPALVELIKFVRSEPLDDILKDPAKKQQYASLIIKIIQANTTINGDIAITTGSGNIIASGKINWPTVPNNEEHLFLNAQAKINLKISTSLLDILVGKFLVPPATPAANTRVNSTPTPQEKFNRQVAQLAHQGKLPLSVAMQIIDMQDKQLSSEAFHTKLNQLGLAPDLIATIDQAYAQVKVEQVYLPPIQPADIKKSTIESWVSQGYIIPDNNDYKIELTLENGMTKINGKIPPKNLFEPPTRTVPLPAPVTPTPAHLEPKVQPLMPATP